MKAHLKRLNAPRTWKILKREKTWIARPRASGIDLDYTLPILVLFRDMIGLVHTVREMKYALMHNEIFVNGKRIKDYKHPVSLFDVVSIPKYDLYYRVVFNNGYMDYIEIPKEEANLKIGKVMKKTILPKNKAKDNKSIQLNLFDGFNLLTSDNNINTQDSVLYTLDKKEIKQVLPFKEGSLVYIMRGRNEGKLGKIKKIEDYVFVDVNGYEAKLKKEFLMVIGTDKPVINLVKS